MIHETRLHLLNERTPKRGKFVAYWMQASQRAECNHALEYAIQVANARREPVVAFFVLYDRYPEANLRSYAFMLQGLRETQSALRGRGIEFVSWAGSPEEVVVHVGREASMLVTDCGYTRIQRQWRENVGRKVPCQMVEVESDVVVPTRVVSPKEEYAARTIRPKIAKLLPQYLVPLQESMPIRDSLGQVRGSVDLQDVQGVLASLDTNREVSPSLRFPGGTAEAKRLLEEFIATRLDTYEELRQHPDVDWVSHMSPYLHFGQISPLQIALAVSRANKRGTKAYLEELIVRRELSINFVIHNPHYDRFECLPQWAKATLEQHRGDRRETLYSLSELEDGRTHDRYWNAAQWEMVTTGKMHNTMRMYWGKKILEWTANPQDAYTTALYLNNKYELDGRDPNSYAGIAWCFGKHDRPWKERPIFGTVRYMNAAGLERKYNMDAYVRRVRATLSPV